MKVKNMSAERHKLRRKVEQLKAYQGRHSSFTTIYVPPSKNLTDVISFVKSELAGAENIRQTESMFRTTSQQYLVNSQRLMGFLIMA